VPDFRASERTFQLLSQVAGRAGRSVRPGRVFFQTLSADHPAIRAAQAHDYEGLVRQLWRERAPLGYPPFGRLVNVVFTGPVRQDVVGVSAIAGQRLRTQLPGWAILGPADCPIERIQNQFRRHIVLKSLPDTDPTPIATVLDAVESPGVRIVIDVDPYSMV
jgi:primosomal protein N' (replication factor Y)